MSKTLSANKLFIDFDLLFHFVTTNFNVCIYELMLVLDANHTSHPIKGIKVGKVQKV